VFENIKVVSLDAKISKPMRQKKKKKEAIEDS